MVRKWGCLDKKVDKKVDKLIDSQIFTFKPMKALFQIPR